MTTAEGKKTLGAQLDRAVVDRFNQFCVSRGLGKGATATAALLLLECVPLFLRDLALRGAEQAIREWFDRAEQYVEAREAATDALKSAEVHPENQPAGRRKAAGKGKSA